MLCRRCYSGLQADGSCRECEEYSARIREQSARERSRPADLLDYAAVAALVLIVITLAAPICGLLFLIWKAITE